MLIDKNYEMFLIEPSHQACVNASKRGIENIICATIDDNGFNSNVLNDCLLLDVIEHIDLDIEFLKTLNDKMIIGAKLIISTSAFMSLWSSHDKNVGHFRRYLLKDLEAKLKKANFEVLNSSDYFSFLFFPILFVACLEKVGLLKQFSQMTDKEKQKSLKNRESASKIVLFVVNVFNKIEVFLITHNKKMPFGSGMILVAQKK
jgi:hypothetical protein